MTILEAIDLFAREMVNEISHSSVDEVSKESLLNAVSEVKKLVTETYEAEKNE